MIELKMEQVEELGENGFFILEEYVAAPRNTDRKSGFCVIRQEEVRGVRETASGDVCHLLTSYGTIPVSKRCGETIIRYWAQRRDKQGVGEVDGHKD